MKSTLPPFQPASAWSSSVTAVSNINGDTHSHSVFVLPKGGNNVEGAQELQILATPAPFSGVTEKVLLYSEANDSVFVFVQSSSNAPSDVFVTLSGHYVDVP